MADETEIVWDGRRHCWTCGREKEYRQFNCDPRNFTCLECLRESNPVEGRGDELSF